MSGSRKPLLLALAVFVLPVAAAAAYALTAPKRYQATARVLVHPIPAGDRTYAGLDVIHDSFDSRRVLGSAAEYFLQPDVVAAAAAHSTVSQARLADELRVDPIAGSNVLLVKVRDADAELAARLANAVVQQGISQRTSKFQAQVSAVIDRLRASKAPGAAQRLIDLESLQGRPDPTLEQVAPATVPKERVGRNVALIVGGTAALAALAALLIYLLLTWRARRPPRTRRTPEERRDREHAERAAELGAVAASLGQREAELAERDLSLKERERLVLRQERPFEAIGDDHAELARRLELVAERERAVAQRTAELDVRERELADLLRSLPDQATGAGNEGRWSIKGLQELVEARRDEFPARVEEWQFYIQFLRQHADANGTIPASFDYLIEDTFRELL